MNAKDFIAIWEYQKAFKNPKPKRKKDVDYSKVRISDLLMRLKEQQEQIKADIEAAEKLLKKEEKKDDKKGKSFNPLHVAMLLLGTSPITGPLLLLYWAKMFAAIRGYY